MFERLTKVKDDLVSGVKQVGGKLNPKHLKIASAGATIAFLLGQVDAVKGACDLNCPCECHEIAQKAAEVATGVNNSLISAIVIIIVAIAAGAGVAFLTDP